MYKDFYEKEIEKIAEILAKDDIHIIEVWTNFQKYIYDISDERNICTDLVLTLDKNPKYMKMIDLEKIENCIKFNPFAPESFSLIYNKHKNHALLTEPVDFNFYEYNPGSPLISMRVEYKKTKDYEDFDIEIDKNDGPYSEPMMVYINDSIKKLEDEFDIDLLSEKFDLTNEEKILKSFWVERYSSPVFGKYDLKFKIYEQHHKYTVEIENFFTDEVCKIKNNFSSYNNALEWAKHIAEDLIPAANECLTEKLQ